MNNNTNEKIGFIFDLDGTLLDTGEMFRLLPNRLAEIYKVPLLNETENNRLADQLMVTLAGKSNKYVVVKVILLMAKFYKIPLHKRFNYLKRAGKMYKEFVAQAPIIDGIEETLKILTNENNIPIAINTTSGHDDMTTRFSERGGFLEQFGENIISRDDVNEMKPHPESILKLSNMMNIPINRLVMVGDMQNDILAGKNAQCGVTIGVLSGFSNREILEKTNPDYILESVRDIPSILEDIIINISK